MRILHTADWHLGRTLHGLDRSAEAEAVLDEIVGVAVGERVDLIVVAGDLFDSRNPSAQAEEAVYRFFLRTGEAGIPSVIIAGNHDSAKRIDAVAGVLKLAGAHATGDFRPASKGGLLELEAGGERVLLATLPFLSERRMIDADALLEGSRGEHRDTYRATMRKLVSNLTAGFRPDAVNLLVTHTTFEGATLANSEYAFHCTANYTVPASIVPEGTNYVAVGHIHKPQPVEGLPTNLARYSGSTLQLDFGEVDDQKYVLIVEAAPGRGSVVHEVPLSAGRRLRRVVVTEDELDRRFVELESVDGWLKLVVKLDAPKPGLKERLQKLLPNLVAVEQVLPGESVEEVERIDLSKLSLPDSYREYLLRERGMAEPGGLVRLFEELQAEVDA